MKIGFDLISDLYLTEKDNFNWENKATSLYCVIAGNISNDSRVIISTLNHLARFYQGVFYIPGQLEFENSEDIDKRYRELSNYCKKIRNVAFLNHHVVIIDGVAILGANGWVSPFYDKGEIFRNIVQDMAYLKNSIEKLQKHLDVKKILIVTNSVPGHNLYFGEVEKELLELPETNLVLTFDSESKVSHWAYGTYKKIVDTTINNVNYICNPYLKDSTYWAKRIDIEI